MKTMAQAEPLHVQDDYAMAVYRDVFLLIWRHHTSIEGCRVFRDELLDFGKKRPRGIALLTIVEELAPMPPAESRESIATTLRDASDFIHASAVVFEGEGFRAAAVRSVVVGLTMLARQRFPHKVFGNLADAVAWMHTALDDKLERAFTVGELERGVAGFRARIAGTG